ncbi:MAG TPA: response regulator [Polyangiaceae bacterium]
MSAAVLLVDDEPALLRALTRALGAAGFAVTTCADGADAARLIAMQSFAVVVSDIDMPQLDGVGLLSLLRERSIDTPVILMTGSPSLETAIRAVEHGAFKYLTKPIAPDQLIDAVTKAVGSRRPSRVGFSPGLVLGERYRLDRLLGEGGMSQVWEALHVRTGRPAAVKVLHAALNPKPEMRQRLLREARVASTLGHPNVVDVWDLFELPDGTPVLVMELMRGRTLRQHFQATGAVGLAAAAELLLPVVSAVGTAHARGVVHRDLKPENIFLADEGNRVVVKVLDFGIAKLVSPDLQDGAALTVTGATLGTPGYMAPEQAFGENDIDCRADVWALGAILYEALAGVRPIEASNVGQVLKVLLVDGIMPLVRRRPELPPGVGSLVDRMLMRERDERPGDLRAVFAELSRHANVGPPAFGPPSSEGPPTSGVTPAADDVLAHARTEKGHAALARK